jgi:hypothetical protein
MEHIQYFESFGDFLQFVDVPVKGVFNSSHQTGKSASEFRGTSSFAEAMNLARNGWEEGTKELEVYASQFTNVLGSLLQIDEYFYDVTGQDFDLDRVLIGEPEAWLNSEPVQVKAPALHTLKFVVNIGASNGVSKESIMQRGGAITALIMLLEKSRRRVELELVTRVAVRPQWEDKTNHLADCNIGTGKILAKQAGDDLDFGKLAFMLAHPSMLRRLGAALKENYSNKTIAKQVCDASYGYSIDVLEEERGDIYAPRMFGLSSEWTPEIAKEFILGELKKQGVELKGDL